MVSFLISLAILICMYIVAYVVFISDISPMIFMCCFTTHVFSREASIYVFCTFSYLVVCHVIEHDECFLHILDTSSFS
jgi:amino acid permease